MQRPGRGAPQTASRRATGEADCWWGRGTAVVLTKRVPRPGIGMAWNPLGTPVLGPSPSPLNPGHGWARPLPSRAVPPRPEVWNDGIDPGLGDAPTTTTPALAGPAHSSRPQRAVGPGHVTTARTSFAEEAVNEVKRQAMSELQKAVSDAERKAHELISTERAKMERALAEARRQASEDALTVINQQEDSSEVGPPSLQVPDPEAPLRRLPAS